MRLHLSCFLLVVALAFCGTASSSNVWASGPWNGHAVVFTFTSDDGDRAANLAWADVFTGKGLTYTIFIPSSWIGMTGTKLTGADLQALNADGIEVASHGRTHVRLTDISYAQLVDELIGSCRDLEAVIQDPNYSCRTIGYPEHAHNLQVMAVAESLGFTGARDGGSNPIGYPNFSLGKCTWSETSLYELPLTVVSSYLVGTGNTYSEALTRAKVDTLVTLTTAKNVWINVFAHTLNDIDAAHMTWILDEMSQKDVWVTNFASAADFYRTGHGMIVPTTLGGRVPVQLSHLTATSRSDGIFLQWLASGDLDYAGINVERSRSEKTGYSRVNTTLLPPNESGKYLDTTAKPSVTYYYRLEVLSRTGSSTFFGPVTASLRGELQNPRPLLGLAAPNPARDGRTTIPFSLPQVSHVTLRILNVSGRDVRTLVETGMPAGDHTAIWDGRDDHGQGVRSGLYIYQLEALGSEATRKLFWIE